MTKKRELERKCTKCGAKVGKWRMCDKCYNNFKSKDVIDYQCLVNIDTPKEIRNKFSIGDIRDNSLQCLYCNDIIRSKNCHDFVQCKCKESFIDGGSSYLRYGGDNVKTLTTHFVDIKLD